MFRTRVEQINIWVICAAIIITIMVVLCSCDEAQGEASVGHTPSVLSEATTETTEATEDPSQPSEYNDDIFTIPEYEGKPSVTINHNNPVFDEGVKAEESFETYGKLDKRGRCTEAIASLSIDTQPAATEERGDISSVHPSGWRSGQGWERCHLIGWQLSAENDNKRNLVTGTHYMNVDGMLPYENKVAWYIEDTGNHVLYAVEPIFKGKNMVCSGVHMQAESVEDNGKGVSFNVFCFNVSPGHEINYKTGEVTVTDEEAASENAFERVYVINKNTMKFHYPSCSSVAQMAEHNKEKVTESRQELIRQGYEPCGNCEP